MRFRRLLGAGAALAAPALGVAMLVPAASASATPAHRHRHPHTLFVSTHGHNNNKCGTRYDPCRTITRAVNKARWGDTVHVERGWYHEQVVVTKRLKIAGFHATVNARGLMGTYPNGQVNAAAITVMANRAVIEGMTVRNAYGEGILVMKAWHVLITHNRVLRNDLGPPTSPYVECQTLDHVPGDCGEGVHLMSTHRARVVDNVIMHNSGGVLVTDELGPAAHNAVVHNYIARNLYDCGVTMPSHNPNAFNTTTGKLQPKAGGVYANLVRNNRIIGNGVKGEGAGVLFAGPFPGTASYDNRVIDNVIRGNGLAGVTIHAHAPGQYFSGNVIEHNKIGKNNLTGDPDANVTQTTGILVYTPTKLSPITVTIAHNKIRHDYYPVWTSSYVTVKH